MKPWGDARTGDAAVFCVRILLLGPALLFWSGHRRLAGTAEARRSRSRLGVWNSLRNGGRTMSGALEWPF
jgi:hypothetical protein